jgi:hypothetical protein
MDLWRAGLGQENLMGVTAVLVAKVDDSGVLLAEGTDIAPLISNYLYRLWDLGHSIGDDQLMALAGWAIQDAELYNVVSLADLEALPAVADTVFRKEMLARAALREQAVDLGRGPKESHDRLAPTTSGSLLWAANPRGVGRDQVREVDLDVLVHGNPELAIRLWNSSAVFMGELTGDSIHYLISARPALVADVLAFRRRRVEFPSFPDVEGQVREGFAEEVFNSAVTFAHSGSTDVATEVCYELIASSDTLPPELAADLLSHAPDIWAIAQRPRSTVVRLLELSESSGHVAWVEHMIRALDLGTGPALVEALGAEKTLMLLRFGGKLPSAARMQGLHGVVAYVIEHDGQADRRVVAEEYIKLTAYSSADWLYSIEAPFVEMKKQALAMAASFKGELSQSAAKALRELRRRKE